MKNQKLKKYKNNNKKIMHWVLLLCLFIIMSVNLIKIKKYL